MTERVSYGKLANGIACSLVFRLEDILRFPPMIAHHKTPSCELQTDCSIAGRATGSLFNVLTKGQMGNKPKDTTYGGDRLLHSQLPTPSWPL